MAAETEKPIIKNELDKVRYEAIGLGIDAFMTYLESWEVPDANTHYVAAVKDAIKFFLLCKLDYTLPYRISREGQDIVLTIEQSGEFSVHLDPSQGESDEEQLVLIRTEIATVVNVMFTRLNLEMPNIQSALEDTKLILELLMKVFVGMSHEERLAIESHLQGIIRYYKSGPEILGKK